MKKICLELEMSEEENKRLRKKLEQLNQEHNTELTEVKKRNDSLLEGCERYRQVFAIYGCMLTIFKKYKVFKLT